MLSRLLKVVFVVGVCVGSFGSALASPFVATFSLSGFDAASPVQSLTGRITYDASSLYAPIDHITAVDLNVNGHSYTLAELGFETYFTPPDYYPWNVTTVGGQLDGVGQISHQTTDFWLRWHTDTHEWEDFYYASVGLDGIWGVSKWDASALIQFDIVAAPVPEPSAWGTLLAGLFILGGFAARRQSLWAKAK
jgi:hypothetical protein